MFFVPSQPGENLGKVCETSLICSPKRSSQFSSGFKGMEKMFYFPIVAQNFMQTRKSLL